MNEPDESLQEKIVKRDKLNEEIKRLSYDLVNINQDISCTQQIIDSSRSGGFLFARKEQDAALAPQKEKIKKLKEDSNGIQDQIKQKNIQIKMLESSINVMRNINQKTMFENQFKSSEYNSGTSGIKTNQQYNDIIDYKTKYEELRKEFDKMQNEFAGIRILSDRLRSNQIQFRPLGLLLKEASDTLTPQEETLRDFLLQISTACIEISEIREYNLETNIPALKTKLLNRQEILKKNKNEAINKISLELEQLFQELSESNKSRDLKIVEPFINKIDEILQKEIANMENVGKRKQDNQYIVPELIAAHQLIEIISEFSKIDWVLQRLRRLRDSGYDVELTRKSKN
jgi:hypothetical protein